MRFYRLVFSIFLFLGGGTAAAVSVPAANLRVTGKTCRSIDITWNRGNGQLCLVTCRKAGNPAAFPSDGWFYASDTRFGLGSDLGNENYCVFAGIDSVITVKNLDENSTYIFEVFEFDYNPYVYLMADAPFAKDSTHNFQIGMDTRVVDSCKTRNEVQLKATAKASFAIQQYAWKFDFNTFYGADIKARMELSGQNNFTLNVLPNMGCKDQEQKGSLYIIPGTDSATIDADKAICTGEYELFTSNIYFGVVPKTGYTRTWIFDNGVKSNILQVYRDHQEPGKYGLTLIVHSLFEDKYAGCSDTFYREYSVLKSTPFSLGRDTCFPKGSLVKLSSPIAAAAYKWDQLGVTKNYYVTDTGNHVLTITDNQGCHTSDTIYVGYCKVSGLQNFISKEALLFVAGNGVLKWQNSSILGDAFQVYLTNGKMVASVNASPDASGELALPTGLYFVRDQYQKPRKIWIP